MALRAKVFLPFNMYLVIETLSGYFVKVCQVEELVTPQGILINVDTPECVRQWFEARHWTSSKVFILWYSQTQRFYGMKCLHLTAYI